MEKFNTSDSTIINIKNLRFKYNNRKEKVLDGINVSIKKGECVLLLGPSGSGKSTLALTLNGLIPHIIEGEFWGRVYVDGLDTRETLVSELTQKVGIVFQDPEAQFVTQKVEDEIAFGIENLKVPHDEINERITNTLKLLGMSEFRDRSLDTLSCGEKQKITLAALLAMHPSIIIFDEPTANLDPVGTDEVFNAIRKLKATSKYTIILIEHKLDDLMHLIDRVLILKDQKLLVDGKPNVVFNEYAELLIKYGIWMPQTAILSHQLKKKGISIPNIPISINKAVETLQVYSPINNIYKDIINDNDNLILTSNGTVPAVEVHDLFFNYETYDPKAHKRRGKRKKEKNKKNVKNILDNINLTVPKGDILAIVGANGAGKTTLAKHLVNILHPEENKVFINGKDILKIHTKNLIHEVGYVFQNPEHQFITHTVEGELSFGLRGIMGLEEEKIMKHVKETLERFDLINYYNSSPFTLSHGEKRRLSVATMTIVGQNILILDEPTFGQDLKNTRKLLKLLQELHEEGRTIIIITHDMNLVAEHAKHVAVMSNGQIIFKGTTQNLFYREDILERARLKLPSLIKLSKKLVEHDSRWNGLSTIEQYVSALKVDLKKNEF